jgi:hypothetical protein
MLHEEATVSRFNRTLSTAIDFLDREQKQKPIISRIIESRRVRLFTEKNYAVGPTACLYEMAAKNSGVDFIIKRGELRPSTAVAEVARQMNIDPKVLMLTWGNWELVFTAPIDELHVRLGPPIAAELIYLGDVVDGSGRVRFDTKTGADVPNIGSYRFTKNSTFSHGLARYIDELKQIKIGNGR